MSAPNLRQVRTFKDLIRYLEDELHWPLDGYAMEDLTFDYEPADLGLKDEDAAKVKSIRQLRPLASDQPWGIFFIEFDKKKLPVVLLRRILSHLVVRKRASANKADRAAWNAQDLLFVSAFGPEDEDGREIGFAHFHTESGDLPSLRVLGWDGADTTMKLNAVAATLSERLQWKQSGETIDHWRERWAGAFKHRIGHIIRTSDMLAEAMAALAKRIRDAATTIMQHETERGPLRKLHRAFQTNLIHDLTPEGFADTYAQTITYGLFTAALSKTDMSGGRHGTALIAGNIIDMVPVTNPFLKEMLSTFLSMGGRKGGIDFDELGIQDVVELLRGSETDLPAIRDDFGNRTRGEDPVIHFYEHFLSAYNKKLKIQRGVFYTPQPVVSYIVRSAHELLQTEFGLEDGLASTVTWGEMLKKHPDLKLPPLTDEPGETQTISTDEMFVQILDPATGTATFLVEVIDVIYKHLKDKWAKSGLTAMPVLPGVTTDHCKQFTEYWNLYVPAALLPRLHAYELMMAPYAIAHMKIGLKLTETGYKFATEERARIYLTNALEPWMKQLPLIGFDALAHEAAAVNEIKRHKRFTVVLGNPPYSKSMSKHPAAISLVDAFKVGVNEKKSDLTREEWKFMRFAYLQVEHASVGIVGLVINNAFISSPTLRGIRRYLLEHSSELRILDLHGDSRKGEVGPDGSLDKNVFEIQQGVTVLVGCHQGADKTIKSVSLSDLFGSSTSKYELLNRQSSETTLFGNVTPEGTHLFFRQPSADSGDSDYRSWPSVTDIFLNSNTGIQTKNDDLFSDPSYATLQDRMRDVLTNIGSNRNSICASYSLKDSAGWRVDQLSGIKFDESAIQRFLYKPFDHRFLYYHTRALGRARHSTMQHMQKPNLALLTTRQVTRLPFCHAFVSAWATEEKTGSHDRTTQHFPLFIYHDSDHLPLDGNNSDRVTGLASAYIDKMSAAVGVPFEESAPVTSGDKINSTSIFQYIYSVLYAPSYRNEFGLELMGDFPRIPFPGSFGFFNALARLGGELTALHLLESPKLYEPITEFFGRSKEITKVAYSGNTVWINGSAGRVSNAGTSGFRGVPESVWNFHIGGYQVCEKWLKDRKGRTLTDEDIVHYHKIVIALTETIRLMAEIDAVIAHHGGWPGAFNRTAEDS